MVVHSFFVVFYLKEGANQSFKLWILSGGANCEFRKMRMQVDIDDKTQVGF